MFHNSNSNHENQWAAGEAMQITECAVKDAMGKLSYEEADLVWKQTQD